MTVISQVIEDTAAYDTQKIQKNKMKVSYDSFSILGIVHV